MTATTLGPDDIVSAFIAALKADADIVLVVGSEIREAQWQGDDFEYPAIRVEDMDTPVSPDNGNCHGEWFDLGIGVHVFTEGSSSLANRQLMKLIGRLFQNRQVASADLRTQLLDVTYIRPLAYDQNTWHGEVLVRGRVKEL